MSVRRTVLLSVVVGVLLAVSACGKVEDSESPLGATKDLEATCTGGGFLGPKRTAFPDAAANEGNEHPVVIMEHPGLDEPSSGSSVSWSKASGDGLQSEPDPTKVQLVACAEHEDEHESVGTCTFDGGETANVLRSSAKVTVYEARSAEKVAEVTVDAAEYDCPPLLSVDGDSEPTVYTSPTVPEYREALAEAVPGIELVS